MTTQKIAATLVASLLGGGFALAQTVGPSTTTDPYLIPNATLPAGSVTTTSILTAGDAVGGYRLSGIPDGMGAFSLDGDIELVVNHEFGATQGVTRAHGATGAFVSRWTIDPITLDVLSGRDHNTTPDDVYTFDRNNPGWNQGADSWERLCSGDLPPVSAFSYLSAGTTSRIFLSGEETRPPFSPDHGRVYAHVLTGSEANTTWELPALGRMAWENALASPYSQLKTIVVGMDDADRLTDPNQTPSPSELYIYIGTKKKKGGNEIWRAGLVDGFLYGARVSVNGVKVTQESNSLGFGSTSYVGSGRFDLYNFDRVSLLDGNQLQAASIANDVTRFQRIEDGAWDVRPGFESDFYFVTTASVSSNSRLFRMRFDNITRPELGGQIEILLNGTEGYKMLDNIALDRLGRLIMVEDVGSDARLGKVWMYDLTNKNLVEVAAHDPRYFAVGGTNFRTTNEEASGVIDAFDQLGEGWYLINVQAHFTEPDPELVEGGQLLALYIDPNLGR